MTYTCNPITWEAEAGTLKFEASLGYLANSKTAWASCQDPISETQSDKKKRKDLQRWAGMYKWIQCQNTRIAYWVSCGALPGKTPSTMSKILASFWHVFKAFTNKTLGNNSYLEKNILRPGTEGMGQSVKTCLGSPEDLSSAPRTQIKMACVMPCACNSSSGKVRRIPWSSLAC